MATLFTHDNAIFQNHGRAARLAGRGATAIAAIAIGIGAAGAANAAEPLVDTDWLQANLGSDNLVVLDVRSGIDGGSAEVFAEGHIPGSIYSNYTEDGWRVTVDGIQGKLPPIDDLEELIGSLGIGNDDHVVVVPAGTSSTDFGSAARIYWTFKVLGHDEVSILEGGYAGWVDDGLDIGTGPAPAADAVTFSADFRPALLASTDDVIAAIDQGNPPLIDARPVSHYTGAEVPGNIGVAGTLPGAISVPHTELVLNEGRDVVDRDVLAGYLEQVGLTTEGDQIAFCNTGHWAAVGWFLLSEVGGNPNVSMYDGSMAEWVADDERLVELSADRTIN